MHATMQLALVALWGVLRIDRRVNIALNLNHASNNKQRERYETPKFVFCRESLDVLPPSSLSSSFTHLYLLFPASLLFALFYFFVHFYSFLQVYSPRLYETLFLRAFHISSGFAKTQVLKTNANAPGKIENIFSIGNLQLSRFTIIR